MLSISASQVAAELSRYDGCVSGSYKHDVPYQHDAHAPAIILHGLQRVSKIEPSEPGPFSLKEESLCPE